MEHGNGALGLLRRGHFHKAEALGTSAGAVTDNLSGFHGAGLREQGLQIRISSIVRQVAYIKFCFHRNTLLLSVGHESEATLTARRINCA